jgi:GR25 family glycosyltransferase involved in LPS biosynthesis
MNRPEGAPLFDELYVIHCKRLAARRDYLRPVLCDLGWAAHWVDSYDPDEIPRRHLWRFRRGERMLTVAEISVYLKHLEAWRRIARQGAGVGFVIEDDAVFPPEFPTTFARYRSALTAPFDLAFFGACAAAGGPADAAAGGPFEERAQTRSMSGYLITAAAGGRLLAQLAGRPILEPIDHAVNRILGLGAFKVLWSQPPLLLNGTETKLFGHSLGVPWREDANRPSLYRRAKSVRR